jgi:mono/diheme cytochrome c family protein
MHDGKGQKGIFPPLAKSDYLFKNIQESIKAIKFGGIDGEIIVNGVKYNSKMEKMGLYDDEIADIMNYILNSWGNNYDKRITEEYVKSLKTLK